MNGDFLREALIYLAAAVIAAPLFNRLKLGSVLGYLVAGVLIGPHLLDLAGDAEDTMHFAEFGLVILLFLVGLEIRPAQLWSMRTAIFGLGGAQVLLSGLALALAAMGFGVEWRPGLALGLILALSSTAIVLQTLEERGLRHTAVGRHAFSILLLQDLAVIPLFALLPLLASVTPEAGEAVRGSLFSGASPWLQALATLSAVALVLVAGRFLTRPVFRFIAETRQREIFTAAALLIVVSVTALMQSVGLSPALGAFLAGVVLGDSEYRREIESDIEPFRGLLLGLFFITIGSGMDVGAVTARPLLVLGLTAGLMAVKGAILFALLRTFRAAGREAGAVAVALCQGGEFAFVLFGFASGAGVLEPGLVSLLTVVVALSMALTPLLMIAYSRLQFRPGAEAEPEAGELEDRPDVIVAGFGRFGQIVGRVLIASGYRTVVLESSAAQIELLRRFGRRVYYGDATRIDLLRAAGAAEAKLLVVAIDEVEKANELVEVARAEFPKLTVIARAWDRRHAYQLQAKGAHGVERETFEGGLALAAEGLRRLGMRPSQAQRAVQIFRRHDRRTFEELAPLWNDEERYVVASRESSRVMERVLAQDLDELRERRDDDGWDPEGPSDVARPAPGGAPRSAGEDAPAGRTPPS